MVRCYNCGQELIEIENDGLRLAGCLTCNLWAPPDGDRWVRCRKKISEPFTRCDTAEINRAPADADPKKKPGLRERQKPPSLSQQRMRSDCFAWPSVLRPASGPDDPFLQVLAR